MRQFSGLIALAIFTLPCTAADSTPQAIDALVQKLGSDQFSERESAGLSLLKIGQPAIAAVKAAADNHADPEVRERAAMLLEPLSKSFDSSKLLAVKPVKIEYTAQPLTTVISDLKTRTGIPLLLDKAKVKDEARLVTVPAGEYLPWEAIEVVLKAAGLKEDYRAELPGPATPVNQNRRYYRSWDSDNEPNNYTPGTAPIVLVDGVSDNLPTMRSGGVRVVALPANFVSNRVIRGAGRVIFHLDVAPVPTLGWSHASGIRVSAAEDEDGRPVFSDLKLHTDPFANAYDPWGGGWGGRWGGGRRVFWAGGGFVNNYYGGGGGGANENPRLLAVALRTNDRATTLLRKFEGVILGDVLTPNVPIITVEKLEAAGGKSFTGPMQSALSILDFKKNTDGTVTMKMKYESMTQWGLMQMNGGMAVNFLNGSDNPSDVLTKIKYYDADGKALPTPNATSTSTSSDGIRQSVETHYQFKKTDKLPSKMIVTGTKVTGVEVPFKMTNVRVP